MEESEKWQKRYQRERKARTEAEQLLEEKSLALYTKTQELDELVAKQKNLIEERTRELATASEEARLLSDAVSRTENGVIITGPDNKVIWANQAICKISGYETEELIGSVPGHVLQGSESEQDVRKYMRGKIRSREPFEADILNYHKEGHPYWIHLQATPVLDEAGNFKYFVAIQSDITEERETRTKLVSEMKRANIMAKRAKEANAAKTKFLATMSHELRTPLNGIIGYAQILEKSGSIEEKAGNQIRIMRRSGEHLLSLINDLLDISKIEAGSHNLTPSRFDLKGMLQSVVEIISSKAYEKGLELILDYNEGKFVPDRHRARLFADSRALRQVLINLLGNAIKFTDKGSVTIKVEITDFRGENAILNISVIDTGRGIPEDKIDTLFDAFKQVDEERDVIQGSGLGLFIALRLVQEMGDEIHVGSTLGVGSSFSFKIECPMDFTEDRKSSVDPRNRPNEEKFFPSAYDGRTRRLLIVDDVEDNRNFLIDLLQPIGFELEEAENGTEALKKIKNSKYDLVLSDVIMPFMSGYDLIKTLRADPECKDLCVIAVSASLMQLSTLEKDKMKNFDGFISKPVQASELLATLRNKLELDWIYPETEEEKSSASQNQEGSEISSESNYLMRLHWLARIGDIKAFKTEFKALKDIDEDFYKRLSILVRGYKAQQSAEAIENYMHEHKHG